MEPLSAKDKSVKYLLCVIICTKYAWVKPFKDKKGKIVNESNCKPNKLWGDQGREFIITIMIFKFTPHIIKTSQ